MRRPCEAQAEGDAQATRIRAEAQAEANKLLAHSLTPELIRYQQLQRWDGRLPIFAGGGVTPLMDMSSLVSPSAARYGQLSPARCAVTEEAHSTQDTASRVPVRIIAPSARRRSTPPPSAPTARC